MGNQPQSTHTMRLGASYIGTHTIERVGYILADAGDVNGDGYNDFIIGNYHHSLVPGDGNYKDTGGVYLILGRTTEIGQNISLAQASALFVSKYRYGLGYGIASKGDANGDGLHDILMGARGGGTPGFVYLVFGRAQANWGNNFIVQDFADASYQGESNESCLGTTLDFIGDLNGDGCDEFALCAPFIGKVYLFKGKRNGWQRDINVTSADAVFVGNPVDGEPGYAVRGIGDVNGDGIPDFAIGVMADNTMGPYVPAHVYIIFGRREIDYGNFDITLGANVIFEQESGYADKWIGTARFVAPAGDVNKDGYADLLVSANQFPSFDNRDANNYRGKTYLILGKPTNQWKKNNNLSEADASYIGWTNGDISGFAINGNLDLNGDGYGDFLIGALQYYTGGSQYGSPTVGPGKIYWIKGAGSGWSRDVSLANIPDVFNGESTKWGSGFGHGLTSIGDFNGDGSMDFAVSAPFYGNYDYTSIGKIYLYFGEKVYQLIKGSVTYWKNSRFVTGASVLRDGTVATSTDVLGKYLINQNEGTSCVVSISKQHNSDLGDTTISSYDAVLTARYAVGIENLDTYPCRAADVNGDGKILMNDAMEIARHAVGIEGSGLNKCGDWFFEPISRTYTNIQSDQNDQNYTASIRGDVDGSWNSGILKRSATLSGVLERSVFWKQDTLKAVFSLRQSVSILSFDLSLEFDSQALSYHGYEQGSGQEPFTVFDCVRGGLLKMNGFCIEGPARDGDLVVLKFKAIRHQGNINPLRLKKIQLNQEVVDREAELTAGEPYRADDFSLLRNYPNPFNSRTMVEYSLEAGGSVRLDVVDVQGKLIRVLESGNRPAGKHRVEWNGMDPWGATVTSGVYIIRLIQGTDLRNIKVLLLK